MSANNRSSVTTTGLAVGDTNDSRIAIQRAAMTEAQAAASGEKMAAEAPASRYTGHLPTDLGLAASQPSELRPVTVQPVDRKTITGSTPGDFRADKSSVADAAMSKIANPPGPREQMREARLTSKLDSPAPQTFVGNLSDSDSGV